MDSLIHSASCNRKQLVDYDIRTKDEVLLNLAGFLLDHYKVMDLLDSSNIGFYGHGSNANATNCPHRTITRRDTFQITATAHFLVHFGLAYYYSDTQWLMLEDGS
jgi:hypothetical protein